MIPMKHQKTLGLMPWDPFVTTYSSDYKPFNERHPEVIRWEPRTEAKAAPAFINPPQTDRETWPIFRRYFYKTANDAYGSQCCSHVNTHSHIPPCCSPFPAFLPTFATSISETGVFGSTRTKEAGVARGIGPLLGEEKGQLHYVFGGKTNVLEQQEAKDKIDILYEEDADSWGNSAFQSGLRPAFGLKTSNYLQPPSSSQCSCCAWKPECPNSYCFKMQTSPPGIPLGSTQSLSHVQPAGYRAEPCRTPWQTEYQASYAAGVRRGEWAQP
ncbi:uncharacterized protein LOC113743982 isoform X3 [Larimichthys crocea]|uniref:uncharacterized protein LOC113743982 isoform X3 n=1 Tax=Larimichthys crocea TaxID=215358 RepID=UPI000F5F6FAA|nr:uncharacterized protein LOC113743982 isoform X3 [Larimichthys crocea]